MPHLYLPLLPLASPCSPRWTEGGGYDTRLLALDLLRRNLHCGGPGAIAGTVKERPENAPVGAEVPVSRRVRLFEEKTGLLIGETWSDASTGAYRFAGLSAGLVCTVLAYDHRGNFRAVVADRIAAAVL